MPASPPTPSTSSPTGDQLRPPSDFRNLTVRRLLSRHGQLWHQLVSTELTSVQFGVLLCLGHAPGGLAQSELGAQLHLDKATVTELVRRMGRRGLVRAQRDPDDGRRRIVSLTAEGRRTLQELHGPALEVDRRLLERLDATEQQDLDRLLARALQDRDH